jgi:hypothetical protein
MMAGYETENWIPDTQKKQESIYHRLAQTDINIHTAVPQQLQWNLPVTEKQDR